jgi:hypothetical protein
MDAFMEHFQERLRTIKKRSDITMTFSELLKERQEGLGLSEVALSRAINEFEQETKSTNSRDRITTIAREILERSHQSSAPKRDRDETTTTPPREKTEPIRERVYRELKSHGQEIPLWFHVCSTVCSRKRFHDQYPLCSCNPIGRKIAESLIRNAISRIFVNPYQSIMEPIVNGFDAYQSSASTSIGKFGMGFFSFLHWLIGHPERQLIIQTKSVHSPEIYRVVIREHEGLVSFALERVEGAEDLAIHCPKTVHLFDPEQRKTKRGFTNMALELKSGQLTSTDLSEFERQIKRLRWFDSAQLYLNGEPVNAARLVENCVSVEMNSRSIKIFDAATGIDFFDLLKSLLIPSVSTKTVKISKQVGRIRKSGVFFLGRDRTSNFIITVSDVVIVEIPLEFKEVYGDLGEAAQKIFQSSFSSIEIRVDLPENTTLPVARDDVMLDSSTRQAFFEQLVVLVGVLKSRYYDVSILQMALKKYLLVSAQKREISQLILDLHHHLERFSGQILSPSAVELLVRLNARLVNKRADFFLARDIMPDEDQVIQGLFSSESINEGLFGERKTVFVDNYLVDICSEFGLRSWIFVADRYRDDLGTVRDNAPVFLTRISSTYDRLKRLFRNRSPRVIKAATLCYGQMSDLINRFSGLSAPDTLLYRYFSERVIPTLNQDEYALLFLEQMTYALSRCRHFLETEHHSYGTDEGLAIAQSIQELAEKHTPRITRDLSSKMRNFLKMGFESVVSRATFHQLKEMIRLRWISSNHPLSLLEPFQSSLAAYYFDRIYRIYGKGADLSEQDTLNKTYLEVIGQLTPDAMPAIVSYLETKVSESTLINDSLTILTGFGFHLNRYNQNVIGAIVDLAVQFKENKTSLPVITVTGPRSTSEFALSNLIQAILVSPDPPSTEGDYQKLVESSLERGTESENQTWQIIELAINAGTTKNATEAAITEMVQNSLDAIRSSGTRSQGTVRVSFGRTTRNNFVFSVEDSVGIKYESLAALTIPYYSTKSSASAQTTGEMGNGLFNIYRDAITVVIDSRHPDEKGFVIVDLPVRDERQQVTDVKKRIRFHSTRTSGTSIQVVLPNEPRFNLTFANLNNYLSKLLTISPKIARVSINDDLNNDDFYGEHYITERSVLSRDFDPYSYQGELAGLVSLQENATSYLLTKGVPFINLSDFLAQEFPDLNFLLSHLRKGVILYLVRGYTPVQSRTTINLEPAMRSKISRMVCDTTLYHHLLEAVKLISGDSPQRLDDFLENYSSNNDPGQLRFNANSSYRDGRLSSFFTYYRSNLLGQKNIAELINGRIVAYKQRRTGFIIGPLGVDPLLEKPLQELITAWLGRKRIDPPSRPQEFKKVAVDQIVLHKTQTSRGDDLEGATARVASILDALIKKYVDIYSRLARDKLEIRDLYRGKPNPSTKVIMEEAKTSMAAYYREVDHTVYLVMGQRATLKGDLERWIKTMKAIHQESEESDQNYKNHFFNTRHKACTLDHELEHARTNLGSINSYHGRQTVFYGETHLEDDFDKVAIETRKRMDQFRFSRLFLAAFREILRPIVLDQW